MFVDMAQLQAEYNHTLQMLFFEYFTLLYDYLVITTSNILRD